MPTSMAVETAASHYTSHSTGLAFSPIFFPRYAFFIPFRFFSPALPNIPLKNRKKKQKKTEDDPPAHPRRLPPAPSSPNFPPPPAPETHPACLPPKRAPPSSSPKSSFSKLTLRFPPHTNPHRQFPCAPRAAAPRGTRSMVANAQQIDRAAFSGVADAAPLDRMHAKLRAKDGPSTTSGAARTAISGARSGPPAGQIARALTPDPVSATTSGPAGRPRRLSGSVFARCRSGGDAPSALVWLETPLVPNRLNLGQI